MWIRRAVALVALGAASAWSSGPGRAGDEEPGVVINEVMYQPVPGGTEWVELWNTSSSPVSLEGWTLEDSRRKPSLISATDLRISPNAFLVLAEDREALLGQFPRLEGDRVHELAGSWPSLNNSQPSGQPYADLVVLSDARGGLVDSLGYGAEWGIPGISLERMSPREGATAFNWCASLAEDGATPGALNSVHLEGTPRSGLHAEPDPFRPEVHRITFISFRIPAGTPTLRLQVFDIDGRRVRTLLDDRAGGHAGRVAWDGRDDSGEPVSTGIYILYLQAVDVGKGVVREAKGTVVVARGF